MRRGGIYIGTVCGAVIMIGDEYPAGEKHVISNGDLINTAEVAIRIENDVVPDGNFRCVPLSTELIICFDAKIEQSLKIVADMHVFRLDYSIWRLDIRVFSHASETVG